MKWADKLMPWRKHRGVRDRQRKITEMPRVSGPVVRCPRCRRIVADTERGRQAHRQSCVKIPAVRKYGWGKKDV
jgi:hypothetical protein